MKMKRAIPLIIALLLIFDLADDGCLGKAKFVAPQHAAQYSVASSSHNSGKADSQIALPPEHLRDNPEQFLSYAASVEVDHYHKISFFPFHGSSGGIPL
jgi:hypothetical protein